MTPEIMTAIMSGFAGILLGVLFNLITHRSPVRSGSGMTDPSQKPQGAWESFERTLIKGHMFYVLAVLAVLLGVAFLALINDATTHPDSMKMILLTIVPGVLTCILAMQAMQKLRAQRHHQTLNQSR